VHRLKNSHPMEKIMLALADFEYLTAEQLTRLLYAQGSLTYVKAKLKTLVEADFIMPLGGRNHNLPRIYTLKVKGRQFTTMLGKPTELRFRPGEVHEKAYNLFFMRHTLAVIDVLISARLLTQTVSDIVLNNMFQERDLRRKIYVAIAQDKEKPRNICLEPDASLDFTVQQAWRDFFHIELYRHLPMQRRFKQKVQGYLTYAGSPAHQEFFRTSALSIAMFAATEQLAQMLKQWTEDVLAKLNEQAEGQRFFFSSVIPGQVSPTELFLSLVWSLAFSNTPTPLLELMEEGHER
jgi:Replication-relaxation